MTVLEKHPKAIIGQYNVDWLKTEYVTAVSAARTAARFRQYMRDTDLFPNLRWLPSSAAEPRISHRMYYGNVRSLAESLGGKLSYPGMCMELPVRHGNTADPITHIGDRPVIPGEKRHGTGWHRASPGLDRNPAYTGSIFTDNHPYVTEAYKGAVKSGGAVAGGESMKQFLPTKAGFVSIVDTAKVNGRRIYGWLHILPTNTDMTLIC